MLPSQRATPFLPTGQMLLTGVLNVKGLKEPLVLGPEPRGEQSSTPCPLSRTTSFYSMPSSQKGAKACYRAFLAYSLALWRTQGVSPAHSTTSGGCGVAWLGWDSPQ